MDHLGEHSIILSPKQLGVDPVVVHLHNVPAPLELFAPLKDLLALVLVGLVTLVHFDAVPAAIILEEHTLADQCHRPPVLFVELRFGFRTSHLYMFK